MNRMITKKTVKGASGRACFPAAAGVLLCALAVLSAFPAAVRAEECGDCGFLFCEPEPWVSWQNGIHLTTTYALHVTATEINDSPWKNFLWISALGVGIEVFQGACLEHPLHGGFSYKNIAFNELGLFTGVVVHKLISDRKKRSLPDDTGYRDRRAQAEVHTALPLARHLDHCRCLRGAPFQHDYATDRPLRPGLAGLLRPGLRSGYEAGGLSLFPSPHNATTQR